MNLNTELVGAASRGYAGVVRCLLAAGADVNHWSPDPNSPLGPVVEGSPLTALMAAARRGSTGTVECLLAAGADVHLKDEYGDTALHFAVANGHDAIVQCLQAAGSTI